MRDYINLLEGLLDMDPEESSHTAGMGTVLKGTFVNPEVMLQYFPSVMDDQAFVRAWRKILRNQEERLLRNEMFEISRAFCDILRMPSDRKLSFIRRIMNVEVSDEDVGQTAQTIYR